MKKIYSLFAIIIILLFSTEDFFAQGNTCSNAEPFCTSVGTPYSYNNTTGSPDPTDVGCLFSVPNQSWFYIKTSAAGAMTYSLTQSSVAPGGTPDLDVDFIAYGPYTAAQFSVACASLLTGTCTADHNCTGNVEDCSYSSAATETMTLNSPSSGQYFIIMITNYEDLPGYITFSQTGGPASDCSITCPPSTFTLVATQDSNNANIPNGSTVNCSEPFWLDPPDLTPAGQPYNPFSDQLTPCLKVAINPITSQLQADGSLSVYENGTAYWTACPTTCPDNVGGSSTPGSQFNWFLGQVDPNFTHPAVFCRTTTAGTTPTVSLMSCWNNTLTIAGPQTWGTTSCFTLTAPTGTAAYGAASFSIAPATGSVGIVDLDWGKAYVDPSYLPSGTTYTVTYTFNNGVCGNVYGYYVFTVPSTPTITAISSQTVCSGSTVAATNFTVTPSAGASVSWVNNNTGIGVVASGTTNIASYTAPTVTATTVGNFTVASVSNGCIGNPRTFTITVNPKPTANAGSTNTLTCSNPTLSLSGSGGGTYSWTGSGIVSGSTTATPVINSPGTYSLVVTNSLSCASNVSTVSISQNTTTPSPSASNSSTLTCAISTVALTGGPASGVTYQWSGPGFSGGTTSQNAVANAPGTYTLNVTSSVNGCTNTAVTTVTQNTTAPSPSASNAATLTCTTNTVALTGGPVSGVTYQWGGPGFSGGTTSQNAVATNPGTYTLTVTSTANSCTAAATTVVSQNTTAPVPSASNSATLTCSTNTVALTGGPASGVTYQWSGPGFSGGTTSQNAIATAAGTYTIRVTSSVNSCTAAATTVVSQNTTAPVPSASNSATLTCSTNTVALTGGPASGVTYQWSGPGFSGGTTSQNAVATAAGTYTLKVTSSVNSCTAAATTVVSQNTTAPVPSASNSATLTCSTNTVALTGGPASGVTYQWSGSGFSGGTTSQNAVATNTGTYTLTVTSAANSCTAAATTVVSQNTTAPVPSASNSATLTCSTNTVSLTGGPVTGVTYQWGGPGFSGGTTSQNAVATNPGTYTLTVTSTVNSCTAVATTAVTQNTTAPTVTMPSTQTITCSSPSVSLIASANPSTCTPVWTGGVASGVNSYTATASSPNTYTLTVTNPANGCTNFSTTVVSPSAGFPIVGTSVTNSLSCTTSTAQVIASTTTTPVSYNWTGPGITAGATTASATVNTGGQYTVVVTNTLSACSSTVTIAVVQNTVSPSVITNTPSVLNCTLTSVNASATTTTAPVSYTWTGAGITAGAGTGTITVNAPGTLNYTVTNTINNCVTSGSIAVTQNTVVPTITMPASQTITCAVPTVTMIASANPSTCTPVWTGGVATGVNSYTATTSTANIYTLTVTNPANGCANTGTTEITPSPGFPSVATSSTNVITCTLTTAQVVATTTTSPVTYSWSGPSITGGATTATATVDAAGQYSVVVTNTLSMCSVTVPITVSTNTTVITPSITLTGSITCTTPSLTINSNPAAGVTYTWTGGGLMSSPNNQNADVNAGGDYTLSVTNTANGCVGTSTVNVPVDVTVPTVTLSPTSYTTTCATPTVQLNAVTSPSTGVTYVWTSPASGSLNNSTIADPIANGSGIFTLEVTNSTNGCATVVGQNTVEVIPDAGVPTVTVSVSSLSITCTNTLVTTAITTNTTVAYTWNPVPVTGGANPEFDTQGTYNATITAGNGCSTFTTINVALDNAAPSITITPDQTITCTATLVTISTTVTPSVSYVWTGSSIVGAANASSVDVNGAGDYTVTVLNSANGCTATATSSVSVNNTIPTITVTPTSTLISCASPTVGLTATASTTDTPTWLTPSGPSTNPVVATVAGDYTVSVTDAISGCLGSQIFTLVGSTVTPSANAGAAVAMPCGASTVALLGSTTSTNSVSYSWSGPSIVSGGNTSTPIVDQFGVYTLTVTDNVSGCSSTATVNVTQGNVTAAFTANPTNGTAPLTVNFTDASVGASSYTWNFGDGNVSSAQNPSNIFNTNGTYVVTLIASSGLCSDTAYATITVNDGLTLYIPNVFTPNNDGANDLFTIKSTGVKAITLQIFNRWGEKLYEFSGDRAAWDGKVESGAEVPSGTYFFFVKATGFDDTEIEQHGTLNLFR